MTSQMPPKIDVHTHYLPPAYREALQNNGHKNPDGMPAVPEWSPEAHLELMDKNGISKSYLSISSPGTHLVAGDSALAAKVTRECNSYAAELKKKHPSRFGYFASLPIPDVETCLSEIKTSAEEGCDGYVFLTNSHGIYLGDALFDPIFAELNKRKATIFIHPTTPRCPCDPSATGETQKPMAAAPLASKYPNPLLEFLFDTARVVTNLFMSGTVKRCPDVKFILPHLGGAMPPILSRFTGFSSLIPGPWEPVTQPEVEESFNKQFWFDMAGFPFPGQIKGLVHGAGVGHDRLLYGSDFPFTNARAVTGLVGQMDNGVKGMFNEEEIENIYYQNAEGLFGKRSISSL